MTEKERDLYVSVIERIARDEYVSDEELILFSGDQELFKPFIEKEDVTDEDFQRFAESLEETSRRLHAEGADCLRGVRDDNFFRELTPYLSNLARQWLKREGFIDDVDIVDLNEYRDALSFDPAEWDLDETKEELLDSLTVRIEKLEEITEYVSRLFLSGIAAVGMRSTAFTDTVSELLFHLTHACSGMEDLISLTRGRSADD